MEIYSGNLKLSGEDQFANDWNYVGTLFQQWQANPTDESWKAYFDAKCCLEQGLPVV